MIIIDKAMCELNSSQYVCLNISAWPQCGCKTESRAYCICTEQQLPVKPLRIALGRQRPESGYLTFVFHCDELELHRLTNVNSAGCRTGNTLLLNLHFSQCLNPTTTKQPTPPHPKGTKSQKCEFRKL